MTLQPTIPSEIYVEVNAYTREQRITPVKVTGPVKLREAKVTLTVMAHKWRQSKPGRKTRIIGTEMFHYYSTGKMAGQVCIEPVLSKVGAPK